MHTKLDRNKVRITFVLLVLASLLGGLSACSQAQASEIKIGVIAYLKGEDVETSGQPTANAAQLAAQVVNEAGGLDVGGRKYKVVLVIESVEPKPEEAVIAATKLINQKDVLVIVGPQYSRDAIPVAQIAEDARVPMVSPESTNPQTTLGKRYAFRVGFIDDFQGQVVARFARDELGVQKAAVLYDVASVYNKDIATVFRKAFEEAGGQVTAFESYTTGQKDFNAQLSRIRDSGASILFLPNYPEEVVLQAQQARQLGIEAVFLGSDSWVQELASNPELEGGFFSTHWHLDVANEQSQVFVAAYRRAFESDPNTTAALTYDAFGLIYHALQSQGNVSAEAIRNGLASTQAYQGVSGAISYQDGGDPVKSAVILQLKDGQAVFYKLVNP